ncbi:hypothetical protein ABH15_08210 [Methanoculleus taiwanensis]|uniref:Uncharacterized protein n=1 Tax=Methanoculleus taiwanensis TaxID=1550565 RepID=A0A498H197_9EURY|nr:hypothetical protein ABH15_08210 [Methanoculleus taiwanensis]
MTIVAASLWLFEPFLRVSLERAEYDPHPDVSSLIGDAWILPTRGCLEWDQALFRDPDVRREDISVC